MGSNLTIFALEGIPLVKKGDDLAGHLLAALEGMGEALVDGDIVVVAQKIVSKAEGRLVPLADVTPSARATELAAKTGKDPRLTELVLRESNDVLRAVPGVMIVEHRSGVVVANAGIDQSNIEEGAKGEGALLLPEDSDASAERLRAALKDRTGTDVGVIVADSVGRAWRYGTVGLGIGCAGIDALWDQRGGTDMFGKVLEVTQMAIADEVASAANLVMGEAAEGRPAAIVRGLKTPRNDRNASVLVRSKDEDLFR